MSIPDRRKNKPRSPYFNFSPLTGDPIRPTGYKFVSGYSADYVMREIARRKDVRFPNGVFKYDGVEVPRRTVDAIADEMLKPGITPPFIEYYEQGVLAVDANYRHVIAVNREACPDIPKTRFVDVLDPVKKKRRRKYDLVRILLVPPSVQFRQETLSEIDTNCFDEI